MKAQTEGIIRNILSLDKDISETQINNVIALLNCRHEPNVELISVLKIREVAQLLQVSRFTVHRYVQAGLLEKVYGAGIFMLGISKKSYIRFTEQRSYEIEETRSKPQRPKSTYWADRRRDREIIRRKIAWALRKFSKASNHDKYEALIAYYETHKGIPFAIGCDALNIPPEHFANYRHNRPRQLARCNAIKECVLGVLRRYHPDKDKPIIVASILKICQSRKLHIGTDTLNRIIDEEGYKRFTRQRHKTAEPSAHEWYHDEDFVECD